MSHAPSPELRGVADGPHTFDQALERLNQAPQLALPLTQDHALIRPAAEYGELFNLGAQQQITQPSLTTGETNE
jgi:predicted RNase H-like HicB family nuclease